MGLFEFVVANEYVCDVTLPTQVIKYNQCCSRWISQSDCSIHIWLNYILFNNKIMFTLKRPTKAEFIFHPILMQILAKWSSLWVTDGLCNNFCYFILKKDLRAQIPKFLIFRRYTEFLFCFQFLYFYLDWLHSDLAVLYTYFLILLQFLRGTRDQLKGPKSTKFKHLNFLIFQLILISFLGKVFISLRY